MRILHEEDPFSEGERQEKKENIRTNVKDAILTIAQAMAVIDPPVRLERPEDNGAALEFVLARCPAPDFDYPAEFWEHAEQLWADPGIKKCFERSNEYQLIDSAKYFLGNVFLYILFYELS